MGKPETVHRCDQCSRVVATQNDDGSLTIESRHDQEKHSTTITPTCTDAKSPNCATGGLKSGAR